MHKCTVRLAGIALGAALLGGCALAPPERTAPAQAGEGPAERWSRLGADERRAGDLDAAETAYRRALEIDPDSASAREGLGTVLLARGQYALARTVLEGAVAIEPVRPGALAALGVLLDALERHAEARERYAEAMAIAGRTASLLNNLGYSHYLEGDLAPAIEAFEAAVAADAGYERGWANLALARFRAGDEDGALEAFSRTGRTHSALNNLGYLHLMVGDEAAARRALQRSRVAAPRCYERAERNLDALGDPRLRRALAIDRVRAELALAPSDGVAARPSRTVTGPALVPFDGEGLVGAAPLRDVAEAAPARPVAASDDAGPDVVGDTAAPGRAPGATDAVAKLPDPDPAGDAAADEPVADLDESTVRAVQRELLGRGFEVGRPDGVAGPRTVLAIRLFKVARRMTVNGAITPRLLDELGLGGS